MIKEFYQEDHNIEKIIDYNIYTDGSCKTTQYHSFGAWGFIITHDDKKLGMNYGTETNTTNQKMELLAVVKALECVSEFRTPHQRITVYSDSAYVINCYSQRWYDTWLRNGWTTASGKSVSHKELWEQLIPYFNHWWFSFIKVKGHSDNYWNNMCDKMVQDAAAECKNKWRA